MRMTRSLLIGQFLVVLSGCASWVSVPKPSCQGSLCEATIDWRWFPPGYAVTPDRLNIPNGDAVVINWRLKPQSGNVFEPFPAQGDRDRVHFLEFSAGSERDFYRCQSVDETNSNAPPATSTIFSCKVKKDAGLVHVRYDLRFRDARGVVHKVDPTVTNGGVGVVSLPSSAKAEPRPTAPATARAQTKTAATCATSPCALEVQSGPPAIVAPSELTIDAVGDVVLVWSAPSGSVFPAEDGIAFPPLPPDQADPIAGCHLASTADGKSAPASAKDAPYYACHVGKRSRPFGPLAYDVAYVAQGVTVKLQGAGTVARR